MGNIQKDVNRQPDEYKLERYKPTFILLFFLAFSIYLYMKPSMARYQHTIIQIAQSNYIIPFMNFRPLGEPTLEKAALVKLKREAAELDTNNIIQESGITLKKSKLMLALRAKASYLQGYGKTS